MEEAGEKKWTIHIIAAHRLEMMEIAGPRCRGLIHADCDSWFLECTGSKVIAFKIQPGNLHT